MRNRYTPLLRFLLCILPSKFGPEVPALTHEVALDTLADDAMPWASVPDLIVMKVFSAPVRAVAAKKEKDKNDIKILAQYGKEHSVKFDEKQKTWVQKQVKDYEADYKDVADVLKEYFGWE